MSYRSTANPYPSIVDLTAYRAPSLRNRLCSAATPLLPERSGGAAPSRLGSPEVPLTDATCAEAQQLIQKLTRRISVILAADGDSNLPPPLREYLERLLSALNGLDPSVLPAECSLYTLRGLDQKLAPLSGEDATKFFAEFFAEVGHPGSSQNPFIQGMASQVREEIAKAPNSAQLHERSVGAAVVSQFIVAQKSREDAFARRMVGEDTRTKVQAAWRVAETECRAKCGDKTPRRKDIAAQVEQKLGLPKRTVERYAPKR